MLVHICCSVDAHYFLERLRSDYPDEHIIGYFYNPNIHPENEYKLRYIDTLRSCNMFGIELIDGSYDVTEWLTTVKGYENEPEKGKRCAQCFDMRFEKTALMAKHRNQKSFATTLSMSPLKSKEQIKTSAQHVANRYGLTFVDADYRAGNGASEMSKTVKENRLYRQNYCGCQFGLLKQRQVQNQYADELSSPLSNTALPGSIEERLALYQMRNELESVNKPYLLSKTKFLNYRQLNLKTICGGNTIALYALPYSVLNRTFCKTKVEAVQDDIYFFNREGIKAITRQTYNRFHHTSYSSINEIVYNPPTVNADNALRQQITQTPFSLSPIFVFETVPETSIKVTLLSRLYEDQCDNLTIIN